MLRSKIVSISCLAVFLVGLIQPVLPMIEYFVFKESIIEFLCEKRDEPENDCEGFCYLTQQIEANDAKQNQPETMLQLDKQLIYLSFASTEKLIIRNSWSVNSFYLISHSPLFSRPHFHPPDLLS